MWMNAKGALLALCLSVPFIAIEPAHLHAQPEKKTAKAEEPQDPRAGDIQHERSKRLLAAIDEILKEAADVRNDARKLPSKHEYSIIAPPWVETREDRQKKVNRLLDAALEIVTEVPVVELQKKLSSYRDNIKKLEDRTAALREKRLDAPESGLMPGLLSDTVDSIDEQIAENDKRIDANKQQIGSIKKQIHDALKKSGVEIGKEQLDILLGSVIGGDLVRLVAAFNAAKAVDNRLNFLMEQNGENITAARRYFAMHASLFALLVHAQEMLLGKIDTVYLPRLNAIVKDISIARKETYSLLRDRNRVDQRNMLLANLKSQRFAEKVAKTYRSYLLSQRSQLSAARQRTLRDLRIADNTFLTVEASFQLRTLIKDATTSFEAIQKLEAPGFENVFRNKELKREFENLTRKLAPTS